MATQTVRTKTTVRTTLTEQELTNILAARYGDVPLVSAPDVEYNINSSGSLESVTITYEIGVAPVESIVA